MLTEEQKEAIVDSFPDAAFERVVELVKDENYGLARRIIRANGVEDAEAIEVLLNEGIECAETDAFLTKHRDYPRTDEAYSRVSQYLADRNWKWTAENLGRAWEDIQIADARRAKVAASPNYDTLSNKEVTRILSDVRKQLIPQEAVGRRRPTPQGLR